MSHEQSQPDHEPEFGITPISDEMLHGWMENGHGQPEPETHEEVPNRVYPAGDYNEKPQLAAVEKSLDTMLEGLYKEAEGVEEWNPELVTVFLRAAAGKGLQEGRLDDGSFFRNHGYDDPTLSRDRRSY